MDYFVIDLFYHFKEVWKEKLHWAISEKTQTDAGGRVEDIEFWGVLKKEPVGITVVS